MERFWVLIPAVVLALLLTLHFRAVPSSSWMYDWGLWGAYPQTRYKSSALTSPLVNYPKWDPQCDDGVYLLSPRGTIVSDPGPMIIDARGNLVWKAVGYGEVTDFRTQRYNGSNYLTFWAGERANSRRYGFGTYYMLDRSYKTYKTLQPVGEALKGDLHEFTITESGTALMTVYHPVQASLLSIGGPSQGWLLDSLFQEVDIETGHLIFEWRASEHIPVEHTMRAFQGPDTGTRPENGFDYFHINSVDKDHDGNYIISGRHSHQIVCISAKSGSILWILGGKHNMFRDLSDERVTGFQWQHHVRVQANNTISLLDNAKSETGDKLYYGRYSRGLLIRLDTHAMSAESLQEYADPQHHTLAQSQGSLQILDDGKVVLDYGFLPTFSEFSADGQLLCEIRIAPWLVFHFGMVTSYRTFKSMNWIGTPSDPPTVFLDPSDQRLFVSWNGATNVGAWLLQGADWENARKGLWSEVTTRRKDGFETSFEVTDDMPEYLRVVALTPVGSVLRHSEIIKRSEGNAPAASLYRQAFVALGSVFGSFIVLVVLLGRKIKVFWRRRSGYELIGIGRIYYQRSRSHEV